jgi:hypothetical protein
MPHLAGRCDCGREMHFPKSATIGYQWTCRKCGKVWTLSNQGKPLDHKKSKAPPKQQTILHNSYQKPTSIGKSYSSSQRSNSISSGCSTIIGVLVVLGILFLIFVIIF